MINTEDETTVSQMTSRSSPTKVKGTMSSAEEETALVASLFSLVNEKQESST